MRPMPPEVRIDPILSYLWRRIYYYDQNVLMIVCGGTGTCKSGSAISLGHIFDRGVKGERRFNLNRVVFKASDFVKLSTSSLPKGSVIVWDEIGVEHDSRNYYTKKNKLIKYVMQTFRYKNFLLIMTVPDLKSVDIGTRRLLHCYLEMKGPVPNRKLALGSLKFVQVNPRSGREYFKTPRYYFEDKNQGLSDYYIQRPPLALEEAYKKKKIKTTMTWYAEFDKELSYMDEAVGEKLEEEAAKRISLNDYVSIVMADPLECYDQIKKRFVGAFIQSYLEKKEIVVGETRAYNISRILNRKLSSGEISI